jgi:hypothetical protein
MLGEQNHWGYFTVPEATDGTPHRMTIFTVPEATDGNTTNGRLYSTRVSN